MISVQLGMIVYFWVYEEYEYVYGMYASDVLQYKQWQAWELAADPRISVGKKISAPKNKWSAQIRM